MTVKVKSVTYYRLFYLIDIQLNKNYKVLFVEYVFPSMDFSFMSCYMIFVLNLTVYENFYPNSKYTGIYAVNISNDNNR